MFKISTFAALGKVSLKTLRYYDQIGILKPRQVDGGTGYRYYAADQLLELNRILIYKELGFTLPQIAHLLQEDLSPDYIQGMFRLKRSEIQQIIDAEQAKLTRIEERMALMETESRPGSGPEIRIRAEEAKPLAFYRTIGKEEEISGLLLHLESLTTPDMRRRIQGPQVVLWRETQEAENEFEFEIGYFLDDASAAVPEPFRIRTLPPEPMMACMAFHSGSTFDVAACVHLARWIESNDYEIKEHEPGRELYLPLSAEEEAQYIEIQIPIGSGKGEKRFEQ